MRLIGFLGSLVITLGWITPAWAASYYVSPSGNDGNAGTLSAPKQTVQAGINLLTSPGDTLYVRGGTYNLTNNLTFRASGSSTTPIIVTNYPGENVILDRGYYSSPDTLRHPVFDIQGVDYIHIVGNYDGGSLHLRGGHVGNIVIADASRAWGIHVKNVHFSRLVTNDNSGHIYVGIGGANGGAGGIVADGAPASAKILIQDCYGDGTTTVFDPYNKDSDAFFMSFSRLGDCEIRNNIIVGGHLGIFFKHGTANNGLTRIEGNVIVNQLYSWKGSFGICVNRNNADIQHNLLVQPQTTGIWIYNDTSTCEKTPATGNKIKHNTIIGSRPIWLYGQTSRGCTSAYRTLVQDNVARGTSSYMCMEIWSYNSVDNSESTVRYNLMQRNNSPTESIVRVLGGTYPITNLPPSVTSASNMQTGLLFVDTSKADPLQNDYSLAPSSAGKNASTDGTDMGANMALVGRYRGAGSGNTPPTVSASATPTAASVGQSVAFTASASDVDGTISSYGWNFGDGTTGTGASPTHTYSAVGTYTARVTVTDNGGATSSATVDISVTSGGGGNTPPQVTVSAQPTAATVGQAVIFTATATDSDGSIRAYAWSYGDGATANGASSATYSYSAPGTYTASVTVTDSGGATATDSIVITVAAANQPPTVSVTASPLSLPAGDVVTLTANASDADGTIASYSWNLGDGFTTSGASVTHVYATAGSYAPQVTVTDNDGATASASTLVTVTDGTGTLPSGECANWQVNHPDWIWCDDFEQDLTIGDKYGVNSINIGSNPATMQRTTTTSASGSHALVMRWNAGEQDAGNFRRNFGRTPYPQTVNEMGSGPYFDEDFTEIYYRYMVMHPATFQGWSDKSSRAFVIASGSNQWSPQAMIAHVWATSANSAFLASDPASGVSADGTTVLTTKWNDTANLRWLGLSQLSLPLEKGRWQSIEVHLKLNTPGLADGVHEVWIDDQLAHSRTNIDWTGTWRDFGLNGIQIGAHWNNGSPVEQERYFDAFVISRSPIGPPTANSPGNQAPTVSASASPSSAQPGASVSFTATASDSDGTIASTAWTFGDGATATGATVSHAYALAGTYTAQVTVTDDAGATATATVTVTVTNSAATPSAPPFLTVPASDADGTFTLSWGASSGDVGWYDLYEATQPDFSDARWLFVGNTLQTTLTGRAPGTYYYRITACTPTDQCSAPTVGSNPIVVGQLPSNQAPSVLATASPATANTGVAIAFSANATDSDGTITSYAWTFGDGATGSGATVSHAYASAGTYTVQVTVTDNDGATATDTVTATVTAPNQPPTVTATASPTTANTGVGITFSANAADSDGTIGSYAWNFGDGTTGSGASATHAYAVAGTYTAQVTVTDNGGATAASTASVTITTPPTASAPSPPPFLAVPASDADGTYTLSWGASSGNVGWYDLYEATQANFSDAQWLFVGNALQTTLSGRGPGTYYYRITACSPSDQCSAPTYGSNAVVVAAPANRPPTVTATASATSVAAGVTVNFSATASDPDGSIASYAWSFGDGGTATGATASHSYSAAGSYTVQVVVTDNGGATASATIAMTVGTPNQPPTASISVSATTVDTGQPVSFAAVATDTDGTIASYAWDFGDGTTGAGANASHAYAAEGTYVVGLVVTDDDGATASATAAITVAHVNQAPQVTLEASTAVTHPWVEVAFTAKATDPDGTVVDYTWDFGDGSVGRGRSVQHGYPWLGTYTVQVLVTDDRGAQGKSQVSIKVNGGGPSTNLTRNPQGSPVASGTPVAWQAQVIKNRTYEYQYWLRGPADNVQWTLMRDFSSDPTWTLNTTGLNGQYWAVVRVREVGLFSAIQMSAEDAILIEGTDGGSAPAPPGDVQVTP